VTYGSDVLGNNGVMRHDTLVTRHGQIVRTKEWHGVRSGDPVVVNGPKERRQQWTFVAHGLNEVTGEEWVEVRGGRVGEAKGRSFRPEMIYPSGARRGSRVVGLSLASAPQLALG